MDLPPSLGHQRLWRSLKDIQACLGLTDAEYGELLWLDEKKYRSLKATGASIGDHHLFALTHELHISPERVLDGNVDLNALTAHWNGDFLIIPEKYRVGAYTKHRAILNILGFIEYTAGRSALYALMRKLQVHPAGLANPDGAVNIHFLSDLLAVLKNAGFDDNDLVRMGMFSVITNSSDFVARALSRERSPEKVYACLFEELIAQFDLNWDYTVLTLAPERMTVRLKAKEKVLSELGSNQIGSAELCTEKGGIGASFLGHLNLPYAKMKHIRCIHRGDSECVYEFDYSSAKHALNTRKKLTPLRAL